MFTRKHYRAIAVIIKAANIEKKAKKRLVTELGDYFTDDNPRFDATRFDAACGLEIP